jgi:hypothetical protein
MINNYMNYNHPIQHIYEELKELRVVSSQSDFSRLCGRTPMWFSCLKARHLHLTSDAALTLAYRLRRIAKNSLCEETHNKLMRISDVLLNDAESNIAKHDENENAFM